MQREILTELSQRLYETGSAHLDRAFADDWHGAADDSARMRVVVDQVASLTDQSALAWHERVVGS
jgi:dGTPase